MSLEEFRVLRGGVEFYGEMVARQEREKTDWIWAFSHPPAEVPPEKRKVVPKIVALPVYTPMVDVDKIKRYPTTAKRKRKAKNPPSPPMSDLQGHKFGAFTVIRRGIGKWEVKCFCGAREYRSTKAALNPKNTFDACVDCRKPVGKLKSDIFMETGVEVTWEDCFQYIYGSLLEKALTQEGKDDSLTLL
jgi:hypothetical protein